MAELKYKIKSILGGQTPSAYQGSQGQFLSSIAIDPELPVGSQVKSGGLITPVRYEKFSSTSLTGAPMWLMNSTKNTNTYSYSDNGRFHSYSNLFTIASEVFIGTPTSGAGNGGYYYNNYYWLATPTDISRYGPVSSSPAIINTTWTGAGPFAGTSGGFGKAALINTAYPGDHNITYPNHPMHEHYGKLYIGDFRLGAGRIHFIQTSTTTVEGDTDNGTTADALTLPPGYYPFDIESYGPDLVIICSQSLFTSGDAGPKAGKASLFFWDTFSTKPYRRVDLPDTLGTALLTHNGVPYIWSGELGIGVRLSRYLGGNQVETLEYIAEGDPPTAGAVDASGNRICWGGWGNYPGVNAGVYARGYKNPKLPNDALNHIARITGTGTVPGVSAIKFARGDNNPPIIAWRTNTPAEFGIDKFSGSATFNSVFRSEVISVGEPFQVKKIRFPLTTGMAANMTVTPKIFIDDEASSTTLDTINATNFPSKYNIVMNMRVNGTHNFFVELAFTGTVLCPINLPIEITIETLKD